MVKASLGNSAIDESRGYTLVELLVVLALLSMLAGLTIPRFHSLYGRRQLRQAAQQMARDLTTGRLLAIDHGCNYVVRHRLGGTQYTICPQHQASPQSTSRSDLAPTATDDRDREIDRPGPRRSGDTNSAAGLTQQRTYDESIDEELPTGVVFGAADAAFQRDTPAPSPPAKLAARTMLPDGLDKDEPAVPEQIVAKSSGTVELVLYPDGRAESTEVTLQAENGYVVLTVRGLTGGVSVGPIKRLAPRSGDKETPSSARSNGTAFATPTPNESKNAR